MYASFREIDIRFQYQVRYFLLQLQFVVFFCTFFAQICG
jgi:hypothetical protein